MRYRSCLQEGLRFDQSWWRRRCRRTSSGQSMSCGMRLPAFGSIAPSVCFLLVRIKVTMFFRSITYYANLMMFGVSLPHCVIYCSDCFLSTVISVVACRCHSCVHVLFLCSVRLLFHRYVVSFHATVLESMLVSMSVSLSLCVCVCVYVCD